ncbi:[Fructose-bisphosphate aldolase]-lysine N-methyltransferase [Diplonema papillatum]|nr:[Fructose-bisphosphate aldolase]-lysine N-methyltransferase [Diplonema papillatum]
MASPLNKLLRELVAGDTSALEVRDVDGERGIFATRDIAAGEVVLDVDESCFITESRCEEVLSRKQKHGEAVDALSIDAKFCLYLIVQRARGGSLYVDSLPRCFSTLDYASEKEIKVLQSAARIRKVRARRQKLRAQYRSLADAISDTDGGILRDPAEAEHVTPEAYVWAYNVIDSRAFSYKAGYVLIPFADMFNHDPRGISDFGRRPTSDGFYFRFTGSDQHRTLQAGEQVFLRYNTWMGSFQFIKHYGFADFDSTLEYERYPLDVVQLVKRPAGRGLPSESDEDEDEVSGTTINAAKLQFMESHELCNGGIQLTSGHLRSAAAGDARHGGIEAAGPSGMFDENLLAALRVACLPRSLKGLDKVAQGAPVSVENELAVYSRLLSLIEVELAGFDTTVSEDVSFLKQRGGGLPRVAELCLRLRMRDKQLLAIAHASARACHRALARCAYFDEPLPILPCPPHKALSSHIGAAVGRLHQQSTQLLAPGL